MFNTLLAVRIVEWSFSVMGAIGVGVCVYTAFDAWADLRARARLGLNGDLEVVGRVARRGALASMLMHGAFLVLGISALLSRPPPQIYGRSVMVATIYVVVQLVVVIAQVRNQFDRSRVRAARELAMTGDAH